MTRGIVRCFDGKSLEANALLLRNLYRRMRAMVSRCDICDLGERCWPRVFRSEETYNIADIFGEIPNETVDKRVLWVGTGKFAGATSEPYLELFDGVLNPPNPALASSIMAWYTSAGAPSIKLWAIKRAPASGILSPSQKFLYDAKKLRMDTGFPPSEEVFFKRYRR